VTDGRGRDGAPRRGRVALTGGIATGKSHCLARFEALGVPVIDADVIARGLVAPGTPGLAAVVARFGPGIVRPGGDLDRDALASLVFADPAARRDLEDILHPAVYRAIDDWFESVAGRTGSGGARLAMADIPLLYETGRDAEFDKVVVVACSREEQLERLGARGLSPEGARVRIASQLPIEEKTRRADYVIDTSSTPALTDRQVVEVWERLRAER
jgi:dephospho-CoA kinase